MLSLLKFALYGLLVLIVFGTIGMIVGNPRDDEPEEPAATVDCYEDTTDLVLVSWCLCAEDNRANDTLRAVADAYLVCIENPAVRSAWNQECRSLGLSWPECNCLWPYEQQYMVNLVREMELALKYDIADADVMVYDPVLETGYYVCLR